MKEYPRILSSPFAEKLREYIQLMRSMGRCFRNEEYYLHTFDAFCLKRCHRGPLTQRLALDFAFADRNPGSPECARRYTTIRGFANYLSNYEPQTEQLDPHAVSYKRRRSPAYIYTDAEVRRLLKTVPRLRFSNPFRVITYQTMLGLIASTGLRVGEALRLDLGDVDLDAGLLWIRGTKFRKSRIVPIHPTACDRLRTYLQARAAQGVAPTQSAFFLGGCDRRIQYGATNYIFAALLRKAGLKRAIGRKPRIHDLRHTFAVRRVLAWYREGADVQAKLPLLATYLGHVSYETTAYYLNATGELLAKAAERFEQNRSHAHD